MLGLITISIFISYVLALYFILTAIKDKRKKIIAATIMILIPTWDVIIGRAVFYTLCATNGGINIYQTVELEPEYFDEDGVPLFFDRNKFSLNDMTLGNQYVGNEERRYVSKLLNIITHHEDIVDVKNNQSLGLVRYYVYKGGWVFNELDTGSGSGDSCPKYSSKNTIELSRKVFIKKSQGIEED